MSSDVDAQVIQETQKVLGKYVKKLPLTEKLLKKPPFRFLHDLVNSIIKETGFLKGLYVDRELLSENMKEKDDKINFLTKLITATKTITEKDLAVRPNKIIAGLEPTETNLLLQAIGYALENKLDSVQYVSQLKPEKKSKIAKTKDNEKVAKQVRTKDKVIKNDIIRKEKKLSPSDTKPINSKTPTTKSRDSKSLSTKTSKESVRKDPSKVKEKKIKKEESPKVVPQASPGREVVEEKVSEKNLENLAKAESHPVIEQQFEEDIIREEKPKKQKSAKPKPVRNDTEESETSNQNVNIIQSTEVFIERPKSVRPNLETIEKKSSEEKLLPENTSSDFPTEILKPAKIKDETNVAPIGSLLELNNNERVRPRSSLRPPSVRPSSARPGAPRLRNENFIPPGEIVPLGKVNVIIENFNNDLDEEDTVTIQSVPELEFQEQVFIPMPTDKGHLVEQILEQIQQDDVVEHTKHTVNIEWEQDGLRSKNVATKEIEQLKVAIQTLTKTANPLGKLINYLHEDIEAMHTELDTWTNSARQTMADVAHQKRISDESNKPLQAELEQIEENIIKHQQQINSIYGNILRNEIRIRDLLVK